MQVESIIKRPLMLTEKGNILRETQNQYFFEVDRRQIVLATLDALVREGALPRSVVAEAIKRYGIDVDRPAPWRC